MDNARLEQIMRDGRGRTFWFKPVGIPGTLPTGEELFDRDIVDIQFTREPIAVAIGDVLLVYRIGVSKLLYVAECRTPPREATLAEIDREEWRGRWRWRFEAQNLTPEFGRVWSQHNLKPFRLADQYNAGGPELPQNLNGLRYGSDKLRLMRPFAEFVIDKVARL